MNVTAALSECGPDDTCTIQAHVQYVGEEKEWPAKDMGGGQVAPARNSKSLKLAESLDRNAPYIWATYYYAPGAPMPVRTGMAVVAKGILRAGRDPKPGEPPMFLQISGKKAWLAQAGPDGAPLPAEAQSPSTQPPPQGQARSAATAPAMAHSSPAQRQPLPLDSAVKLLAAIYLKLNREFEPLSLGDRRPGPGELERMAVHLMISVAQRQVVVAPATLDALSKRAEASQPLGWAPGQPPPEGTAPFGGRAKGTDPEWVREPGDDEGRSLMDDEGWPPT